MARKIFFICLMILLGVQFSAAAKDADLPEEKRINIAVEITSSSRYKELPTAHYLERFLSDELAKKNLLNVVNINVADEESFADVPTAAENIGELLIFDAVELPQNNSVENFNPDVYKTLGANYVVRCEVLALGATQVEDKTIGAVTGVIGSGLLFGGSNGNSSRDKTLRRVGTAIGLGGFIQTKRLALNTVVNMKFISVETGEILWQTNFIGQAIKHHKPYKGYANAWEQAYVESVENSAKRIVKHVNKYVDRVIIKGKSDKSFTQKKFSLNGLSGGMFF